MLKAAVLGAGYMGSAITFPLSDNNIQVNLWGTWLDDDIIDSCIKGAHPKLKKKLPDRVKVFYSDELKNAVDDCDLIFMAVLSEGFVKVFDMLLQILDRQCHFFKLTKGLAIDKGKVERISKKAQDMFNRTHPDKKFYWATIGGAAKAVELSDKIPTACIYGINDQSYLEMVKRFSTPYYPLTVTDDIIGLELSSAFKNVYSIMIGICDGLFGQERPGMYHNLSAFIFDQALKEMVMIAEAAGGRRETVFGLAGTADFYVASLSGRNRRYGEYVGKGSEPQATYKKTYEEGEVSEGYQALKICPDWIDSLKKGLFSKLPLLNTTYDIIFKAKDPSAAVNSFVKKVKDDFDNLLDQYQYE